MKTTPESLAPIPLLDICRDNHPLRDEIVSALAEVVDSGAFVGGPACREFEQAMAEYCQVRHAIGCASGSDALLLTLMAFGIEPGDEVIVPSFTFFATASAVWRLGAIPVFIDIEPDSFNLNVNQIEDLITGRTKAIIPVHLFGRCADMTAIQQIAQRYDLRVIEDAAQAVGSAHHGAPAGSMGDFGCFSFYPTKNLGGMGDGGLITTQSDDLAERIRLLCNHGMQPRYYHRVVGVNSRLDALQAAALSVKLKCLPTWTAQRRLNAQRYDQMFLAAGLQAEIQRPSDDAHGFHVWNQYTVRVVGCERDYLREQLRLREIGSEIYYPVPLHLQECFELLGCRPGSLPATEQAAAEVLSLPIFPGLTASEQQRIVDAIREIVLASKGELRMAS